MFIFRNKVSYDKVQSPMELLYMRRMRVWLRAVNVWPWRALGETERVSPLLQHKFLFPLWVCVLASQLQYIRTNQRRLTFFELGHSCLTALITFVDCHRITLIWTKWYREVTKEFVTEIHLFHHRNKSHYAMKTYKQVHKYCTLLTNVLHAQMFVGIPLFNLGPLLTNISSGMLTFNGERPANGTFAYCIYFTLPFNCTTWLPGYLIVFGVTIILSYWTCVSFFVIDVYLSVLVLHTWGHLKILDHQLRHFPRPASSAWYTQEESEEVLKMLKQHIDYHRRIIAFVGKSSKAFGPMLGVYLFFHQVCGCILLLECSKLETAALAEFGLLTLCLFQQLIQISTIFELLGTQSESLADAVYSVPWECMGLRARRVLLLFLGHAQAARVGLKGMGLVPVGVCTMAAIIKTSISYFIILRTLAF